VTVACLFFSTCINVLPDKYLLALKCLQAAREMDPENPKLHEQSVRFRQASMSTIPPLSGVLLTASSQQTC
jgi:hypothetical protein